MPRWVAPLPARKPLMLAMQVVVIVQPPRPAPDVTVVRTLELLKIGLAARPAADSEGELAVVPPPPKTSARWKLWPLDPLFCETKMLPNARPEVVVESPITDTDPPPPPSAMLGVGKGGSLGEDGEYEKA